MSLLGMPNCAERLPALEIGDPILWYQDCDPGQEPRAATVTKVGAQSICCSVMAPENQNLQVRDGVLHISDPKARLQFNKDAGAWDYTPLLRRLAAAEELFKELAPCP